MVYELNDVSVRITGEEILQSVSCTLQAGKWISIIGHTGAGKSTFAKVIKGLIPFYSGDYTHERQPLLRDSKGNMKVVPQIGYVFQYPEHQIFETTVYKELAFAPKMKGESPEKLKEAIRRVMGHMELSADLLQENPFQASPAYRTNGAGGGEYKMPMEHYTRITLQNGHYSIKCEAIGLLDSLRIVMYIK